MRRLQGEALEDHSDEGFGPGADLVFSVLAVLIVMLAVLRMTALLLSGDTDLSYIHAKKVDLANAIRSECGAPNTNQPFVLGGITQIQSRACSLQILDNPQFQTLVFNEGVLFQTDESELNPSGVGVLSLIRRSLSEQGGDVAEIQILGHTDTTGDRTQNFQLGSARALAVFNLLTDQDNAKSDARLDPLSTLISVTTYGYYNPVARRNHARFSAEELNASNRTPAQRALNRRIELNVFFRKSAARSSAGS